MTRKTFVVTGSTDGIGRQTSLELLRKGHRVLVHGRSADKAAKIARELGAEASAGTAVPVHADLSRMSEVRALGERIAREDRLDVLIHNAGVFSDERVITEDGHELTVAVNHLAPFLLTHLLLDKLRGMAAARVVNVSSVAHNRGDVDPDDMTFTRGFSGYGAYAASKLMNVLFTHELARRVPSSIGVFALHPGVIGTKLLRKGFGIGGASLAEGAKTTLVAATDPALEGMTGLYLSDGKVAQPSAKSRDENLARRLFEVSEKSVHSS